MKPVSKLLSTYVVIGLASLSGMNANAIQFQDPKFSHDDSKLFTDSLFETANSKKHVFVSNNSNTVEIPCGSGTEVITFDDNTTFSQVASYLDKKEADLILTVEGGSKRVTLKNFFTESNTVAAIDFVTGGRLTTPQIRHYFSVK